MIARMQGQPGIRPEFEFTAEQRAVIEHAEGALLVVAGPGTGKTRVIVERIARLIERGDARPQDILALTFARRAAGEMQIRLARRLEALAGPVTVGTFHSFCLTLVQQHYGALGYPTPPRIIGPREQVELVRRVLRDMLPEALGPLAPVAARPFGARLLAEGIGRLADSPPESFDPALRVALEAVAAAFHDAARAGSLLDLSSLVPEAVRLLESEAALAAELRARYRHIVVDEYQDTNAPQERLLELLAPNSANLMVVGDDDQAIYGFRGSSARNLLTFERRRNARRLDLTKNWRCGGAIQELASRVIDQNQDRLDKQITAVSDEARVTALRYDDLASHARGLAALIDDEVRGNGRRCGDIAVLWRSLGHPLVDLLLVELARHEIPARAIRPERGGAGLRDAVAAILTLQVNSAQIEDEALVTVLESELSDVSPVDAQRLRRAARRARRSLAGLLDDPAPDDPHAVRAAATLRQIRDVLNVRAGDPHSLLFEIWRAFPPLARAALTLSSEDVAEQVRARRLVASFQTLSEDAQAFVLANPTAGPGEFLERLKLEVGEPEERQIEDIGADVVRLLTAHAAKGLEWPVVLVPALEDGVFPATAGARGTADALSALAQPDSPAVLLEEERRLFYVAISRAQERLVLSVDAEGRQRPAAPSRFWADGGIAPESTAGADGLDNLRTPDDAEAWLRHRLRTGTPVQRTQAVYALDGLPRTGDPGWWSLIEPPADRPPEIGSEPLPLAATGLADFRACPYRFKAARLLGLRPPSEPASGMGLIVHAALSDFHAPEGTHELDARTLGRLIDEHWDDENFRYQPIAARYRQDAHGLIANYLRFHAERGRALAVEQPFELQVGGLRVRGRIDAIFAGDGDGVQIVDFKTGRTAMPKTEAATDLQLGIYALAFDGAEDLAGFTSPSTAVYLFISTITDRSRDKGVKSRPTDPQDRAKVHAKLERYEAAIRRWELPPKSQAAGFRADADADDLTVLGDTTLCSYCAYRRICPDFAPTRAGA
jgi:superfamily I DNA/RNA helicase/RecB family exonuclease